jgi:hypothetical protein
MNERLNELRLDAGIAQLKDDPRLVVIDREGNVIDPLLGLEKFAELIVKECIEQVWYSREDGINGNVSQVIKDRIKEHFGVEE